MRRSARLLGIAIDPEGAEEIGRRSRGTPARRQPPAPPRARLRRGARRRARHAGRRRPTRSAGSRSTHLGLDAGDRKILSTIIKRFDGGPVGIESLAASLAEDRDTLEYVYEPYLIQEGFLVRTPRGRQVTRRAYEHLGLPVPVRGSGPGQGSLF